MIANSILAYHERDHHIPNSWTPLLLYHTYPKIITSTIYYLLMGLKTAGVANSVTLIRCRIMLHLIWVNTVCSSLSFQNQGKRGILWHVSQHRFRSVCASMLLYTLIIGSDQGQPALFLFKHYFICINLYRKYITE